MLVGTAVALVGLTLVACGGPQYHYVKSTKSQAFFKVPSAWKLYNEDMLLAGQQLTDQQLKAAKAQIWTLAFDASPKPSLDHVLDASTNPWGFAKSRLLSPQERDAYSLSDLRKELLPVDPAATDSAATAGVELLSVRDLNRAGGLRGNEFVATLRNSSSDKAVTFHQIALVDAKTSRVDILAVGCQADCYKSNERLINSIIASWTVKER
jgi:hypothetical protein